MLKRKEHSIPIIFSGVPQTSTFVADFSFLDEKVELEQNVEIEAEFEIERPTMTIDSIDNYGLMTVTFSKQFAVPEDFEARVAQEALKIEVEPSNESMKSLMGLTWETISFTTDTMEIQMIFENAIHISADASQEDEIFVTVLDPLLFVEDKTQVTVAPETVLKSNVPV